MPQSNQGCFQRPGHTEFVNDSRQTSAKPFWAQQLQKELKDDRISGFGTPMGSEATGSRPAIGTIQHPPGVSPVRAANRSAICPEVVLPSG